MLRWSGAGTGGFDFCAFLQEGQQVPVRFVSGWFCAAQLRGGVVWVSWLIFGKVLFGVECGSVADEFGVVDVLVDGDAVFDFLCVGDHAAAAVGFVFDVGFEETEGEGRAFDGDDCMREVVKDLQGGLPETGGVFEDLCLGMEPVGGVAGEVRSAGCGGCSVEEVFGTCGEEFAPVGVAEGGDGGVEGLCFCFTEMEVGSGGHGAGVMGFGRRVMHWFLSAADRAAGSVRYVFFLPSSSFVLSMMMFIRDNRFFSAAESTAAPGAVCFTVPVTRGP